MKFLNLNATLKKNEYYQPSLADKEILFLFLFTKPNQATLAVAVKSKYP